MLHITNGGAALEALTRAGIAAQDILPWRDVLHEGPVPAGLTLDELSVVRADFIAECGWGERDEVRESFRQRDVRLAGAQAEEEAVLWFESDLYDQLQLLQLLDWFCDPSHRPERLSLVCVDRDPATGRFAGLGRVAPERLGALLARRSPITPEQLELGARGWAAVRGSDPRAVESLWRQGTAALPYLGDALERWLEELPSTGSGLTRTERATLETLAQNRYGWRELFVRVSAREPRPFLGDAVFERILNRLAGGSLPLIAFSRNEGGQQVLTLTQAGQEVLAGRVDAVQSNGIERWWGGTRLKHGAAVWRWDGAQRRVVGPEPART